MPSSRGHRASRYWFATRVGLAIGMANGLSLYAQYELFEVLLRLYFDTWYKIAVSLITGFVFGGIGAAGWRNDWLAPAESRAMTQANSNEPAAIVVRNFGYRFAARERPWLADISCAIPRSALVVIAGRTGSGKSTLLRALAGLIPHHAAGEMTGSVELFGHDTRTLGAQELAATAGLVLQNPDEQLCTTTVDSEIAFGLANLCLPHDEITRRSEAWLARFGLFECRQQATGTLSGGQKQKLLLASILAMGPKVLLFDEPLAQLDPLAVDELLEMLDTLRREGLTIVIAEHRLDDLLPRADRVLILDGGRLAADYLATDNRVADALAGAGLVAQQPMAEAKESSRAESAEGSSRPIVGIARLAARVARHAPPIWHDINLRICAGEQRGPCRPQRIRQKHAVARAGRLLASGSRQLRPRCRALRRSPFRACAAESRFDPLLSHGRGRTEFRAATIRPFIA